MNFDDWYSGDDYGVLMPAYEGIIGTLDLDDDVREVLESSDFDDGEHRARLASVFKSTIRLYQNLRSKLSGKLCATSHLLTKRATPVVSPQTRTRARRSPAHRRTKVSTADDGDGGDGGDSDSPSPARPPYSDLIPHTNRSHRFCFAVIFPWHMLCVLRGEAAA